MQSDISKFVAMVEAGKIEEAISFGLGHTESWMRHNAEKLRAGKWINKMGVRIPAQPGFGPANAWELKRIIPLIGEEEAYKWAKMQEELKTFVWLWDEGRFVLDDGSYLAPQIKVKEKRTNVSDLSAARSKKQERAARDRAAWAAKGGKKKAKAK